MPFKPPQHRPSHWRPPVERAREYDRNRNRTQPGRKMIFSAAWRKASKAWLAQPGREFCAYCGTAPATMVDHFIPHRGDQALFWDSSNWRPCCVPCNSAKAARDEGGFGNPAR